MGFVAARRGNPVAETKSPNGTEPTGVERLRPHIGEWVAVKDDEVLVGASTPAEVLTWLSQHDLQADSLFQVPESEASAGGAAPA